MINNPLVTVRNHVLKGRYVGKAIYVGGMMNMPFILTHYEITDSRHNEGKSLLVAQVILNGERRTLFTESYSLIETIQAAKTAPPYYTKIIKKKDGYYYFVRLNNVELNKLQGYVRVEN